MLKEEGWRLQGEPQQHHLEKLDRGKGKNLRGGALGRGRTDANWRRDFEKKDHFISVKLQHKKH